MRRFIRQDECVSTSTHKLSKLLSHSRPDDPIVWWCNKLITRDKFLGDVYFVASQLPATQYAINMCNDRYLFLVAFAAVLVARQTNLLPPNRAKTVLEDIIESYDDCYYLSDELIDDLDLQQHKISLPAFQNELHRAGALKKGQGDDLNDAPIDIPKIADKHIAAITFTSGSTGRPQANKKNWGGLVLGALLAQSRFGIKDGEAVSIIATVPPQHMYGLETSVMLPLLTGSLVYSGATFYPEDIRNAVANMPEPRILITTPVHLNTCNELLVDLPAVKFIISATAPLATCIAETAEVKFQTQVMEIFGCTETGSIASRRTLDGDDWQLYDGFKINRFDDKAFISGAYLAEPVALADLVEVESDERFKIVGRCADMVNIAGKRGSLSDLNQKLLGIEGVRDGVFYLPDIEGATLGTTKERLVAFVVAPELDEKKIISSLSVMVDPVFLPRPLYKVNSLPRTQSSKLPRNRLTEFYNTLRKT